MLSSRGCLILMHVSEIWCRTESRTLSYHDHEVTAAMSTTEASLEKQAEDMALKTLSALPDGPVKTAKLAVVKAGILKRLQSAAAAPAAPAAPLQAQQLSIPQPPPPPPAAAGHDSVADSSASKPSVELEGVELFGDTPWYANSALRQSLLEEVRKAHAAEKILVASPADEIRRISKGLGGSGHVLGAGAVLRLGGAHHGGYGEADISYAYRQLSRALHPDKNPGVPEAPEAFKRLGEAAEELRQGLGEARSTLQVLLAATQGAAATADKDVLERPQGPLLAEASRLLAAVLGLSGEGSISDEAVARACAALPGGPELLARWYQEPQLLEVFAGAPLRIAYDCSKKPFRMQFLCALARAADAEARRNESCVRGGWQRVMQQFPELGLWRELQEKIKARVWTTGAAAAGRRSFQSKWDDQSASSCASDWGKKWRHVIQEVLPQSAPAARFNDEEVQKLCMALWNDIAAWGEREDGLQRHLTLFRSDSESEDKQRWDFVPGTDLLLLIGEGVVGCSADGFCARLSSEGHMRRTYVEALKHWRTSQRKQREPGQDTTTSAVRLWQSGNRKSREETEVEGQEGPKRQKCESKEQPTSGKEQQQKLNRSPTRVLLITNLAASETLEEDIETKAREKFAKFGKLSDCAVVKVPGAPDKEAVRVFLRFDKVPSSAKAYAAMNGQYVDGRAIKVRFYDEARFEQGDLQKSAPTRVLLLTNVVGLGEVDEGLRTEIDEEVKSFGTLSGCVIKEKHDVPEEEAVRVFLQFSRTEEAAQAMAHFGGLDFGGRKVKARYYSESKFAEGDL
eukprot:TRINITY_DN75935_c0_g1_i1.p1 TRINITY_DN75935_c0_g1~~TRINITY_DN75935_c0_g1_i1.p1  ORF type:complete len:798 (-),score=214.17 TRINITY_DN75935_c0_g1_i1:90-2483(-)